MTLDWALVVVALMAVAVLVGTAIRTGTPAAVSQFGTQVGGLRALSATETLLIFEDRGQGAADWSGGIGHADHPGLGAVWLADPPGDALTRSIPLPQGTVRAVLSFDLVAIDDWALQGLTVSIDGADIVTQRFTSSPDTQVPAPDIPARSDRIALRTRIAEPRELGFGSGTTDLAEQVLHVNLAVFTTAPALTLSITPLPALTDADLPQPLWAIDNLVVVSESLP